MRTQSVASLLTAFFIFAGLAAAQTPSATLVGRITDASRASIAEASVEVTNVDTNEKRVVHSLTNGEYTVSNLQPGTYDVAISKEGFKTLHESKLKLEVDQTARLDAHLDVGAVSQSVEVTAEAKGMGKLTVRTRTGYFPVVKTAKRPAEGKK